MTLVSTVSTVSRVCRESVEGVEPGLNALPELRKQDAAQYIGRFCRAQLRCWAHARQHKKVCPPPEILYTYGRVLRTSGVKNFGLPLGPAG